MRLHHALLICVALVGSVAHAAPGRSAKRTKQTEAPPDEDIAPKPKKRPRYVGSIGYYAAMRKDADESSPRRAKRTRRANEDDARSARRTRDHDDANPKRSQRAGDDTEDAAIDAGLTKSKRSRRARRATIDSDDDDDEVIVKDVVDGVEVPARKPRARRR
jgi:hypothetical protein